MLVWLSYELVESRWTFERELIGTDNTLAVIAAFPSFRQSKGVKFRRSVGDYQVQSQIG